MNRLMTATEIQHRIYLIRDCKVMLDKDLAEIYGVTTKRLNEQVKRNRSRFPSDFMFQLTHEETRELMRSQIATSRFQSWGGRRNPPYVFTEHGAVMLACILKSLIAIEASVQVVRAFNRLKEYFAEHKDLSIKLDQLDKRVTVHDHQIQTVFQVIAKLQKPPPHVPTRIKPKRPIGFRK